MSDVADFCAERRARYYAILQTQKWRRPLAALAVAFAVIGLGLTMLQGFDVVNLPPGAPQTHPMTAAVLLWIGLGVFHSRRNQRSPRAKYAVTVMFLFICLTNFLLTTVAMPGLSDTRGNLGQMGPDTAIILSLMLAALVLRRRNERVAVVFLLFGVSMVTNAAIGKSYSADHFGGHMSTMTLLSLLANTGAVVTIFAPRPLVRVLFLLDEIGLRTRRMLAASVIVPWMAGAFLFLTLPMSSVAAKIESLAISLIVICMAAIVIYSGHQNLKADGQRRRAEQLLRKMATQDQLTGVLNRAGLMMHLEQSWAAFKKGGPGCGMILLDLDHFKRINDSFGHDEGDRVLAALGAALRPMLRRGDALARWGGEEFLLLLPETDVADLQGIAERVREQILAIAQIVSAADGDAEPRYATTASVGVSGFLSTDRSASEAINRADHALYAAKEAGRNRVALDPAFAMDVAA